MLVAWNAIAYEKGEFLRDENGAYIPRNEIVEAIESALVFYYIKKDKALENSVKKRILATDTKPKLKSLSKDIKDLVFTKHPYHIDILEKIYLPKEGIKKVYVERFDFVKKEFVERFETEIFKGTIEDFSIDGIEKIKAALLSYARGLAEREHELLKDTILEPLIIEIQNLIANEWQNTLRIGAWTKTPYKGDLLFFWRIKEVREKFLKEFKIDIRPKDTLFIPKFKEFLGWCELS
ncbi:hypothetical protein [Nitratiruptor sp. YY09-18]|uniref:hypothetical protein n=1 Tax=Nitratiruptor sp. YY09-18 TaxID=2724901 RepID=UPI0019166DD2|nr:hypothetical protein [Nitratiruptor sp. YY09-18]BCD68821.1 hypothetical protein NitYY0918_C1740 [Nitratiruptor sp. YY09-18]